MVADENTRWEAELRSLRQELSELRTEQKEMAESIRRLLETFRTLAAHLGIAGEPYVAKRSDRSNDRDLRGFA